ncbi:SPOR domain-containing protein [Yoonia sp.]|uniref:SPOR domain-containing protein n=1 Tax=Yoonia sp. TaxID=2212373 RepID=UPI003976175D
MTGFMILNARKWPLTMALASIVALTACDENGAFTMPGSQGAAAAAPLPANALNQRPQRDIDVERPDILAITDDGLWDGRPSLGGVWVAHPEVTDPERVVIRNTGSGQEIIGALFRRERENPGPLLQVSSDAAEALGLLPGSPTRLEVVVLRRQEVEVEEAENPVVASLDAPVAVEEAPLEPVSGEADATDAAAAAVVLPAAVEAATAAAEATAAATPETIDVSSVIAAPAPLPAGSLAQIGVYSVEANANNSARMITAAGIDATVTPEELGGRTVWRVIAGPLSDAADVARLKDMGFVDAFVIDSAQ